VASRAIYFVIGLLAILLITLEQSQLVLAASQGNIKPIAIKPTGTAEITQVRWALHKDTVTGGSSVRLVFDVSDKIEIESNIMESPTPRLIITVRGASPGSVAKSIRLDGKIADTVCISAVDKNTTKIVIELPMMIEESDYKVFTLRKDAVTKRPNRIIVDINKPVPPPEIVFTSGVKNKVIVIDPGHGGTDPGAIGLNKAQEKDVTLAVALKVRALLLNEGATVVMTRSEDRDVFGPDASAVDELKARTTVANTRKTDIFVSIHADSSTSRSAGGTSAFYYQKTRYDALLAKSLEAKMIAQGNLYERGVFPANFYVVKRTTMPATLVEMAFISNPDEEKLLVNSDFQQKIARGIVDGIEDFFAQAAK